MSGRLIINALGIGSVAVSGIYLSVRKEHYRCSIPKDTKYSIPSVLKTRYDMVKRLKNDEFDVLIVGGGCTGSAVALDCAVRGIKCAMIEAEDFSSGTSSKSTKLLHGGIRYLESALLKLDFKELRFVWKALEERAHMISAVPFSNQPLPIILPVYKVWQIPYFWFNIKVYELLARFFCCNETGVPSSYYTGKDNALHNFPPLRDDGLLGAIVYYDGQHDDSRTNLLMALTSTIDDYVPGQVGATVANYLEAVSLLKDSDGKICGASVLDKTTGDRFEIKAKVVINCGGPFAEEVRKLATGDSKTRMIHSRGTHIILPSKYSPTKYGLIISKTSDGRVLFILPWKGETLAGTTDNEDSLRSNPLPTKEDVDFICKDAVLYINSEEERLRNDVKSAWSGLRPLLKGHEGSSVEKLSRGHTIHLEDTGLVNVYGGKWTICRLMAEECVDKLVQSCGDKVKSKSSCRTRNLKLYGSHDESGKHDMQDIKPNFNALSGRLTSMYPGLTFAQANSLVESYGYKALDVCKIGQEMDLLKPIHEDYPYIQAEVIYATKSEYACTPVDVLARRTRLAFVDCKAAISSLDTVCDLMSRELKWSASRKDSLRKEALDYFNSMHVPIK